MKQVKAAIHLIRPLNGIVAALSIMPAATISCGTIVFPWREAAMIFFLVSFGYAVNDIFDIGADSINRPNRALPSGRLSPKIAWLVAVLSLVLGSGFLIGASTLLAVYFVVVAVFLYLYAARLSAMLIVGNIVVALLCASVFWLGRISCNPTPAAMSLLICCGILTFLFHLGREIVKDIEDTTGDLAIARSTVPLKWGANRARITAMVIFGVLIVATYIAYWQLGLSRAYLLVITLGVNLPLALIFVIYARRQASTGAGAVSLALKILMLPALLAILLAGVN